MIEKNLIYKLKKLSLIYLGIIQNEERICKGIDLVFLKNNGAIKEIKISVVKFINAAAIKPYIGIKKIFNEKFTNNPVSVI